MPESVTQTRVIAPPPCRAAIIHDDRSFQPSTFINLSEQSDQQPEWAMPRKRTLKSHSVNSRCQPNYDIHARCSETSAVRRRVPESCHSVSGGCSFVCCGQHQGQRSAVSDICKALGSASRVAVTCCMSNGKSRPSPQVQSPTTFERQGGGTKLPFTEGLLASAFCGAGTERLSLRSTGGPGSSTCQTPT